MYLGDQLLSSWVEYVYLIALKSKYVALSNTNKWNSMEFFFIGLHESKDIEFLSQGKYFENQRSSWNLPLVHSTSALWTCFSPFSETNLSFLGLFSLRSYSICIRSKHLWGHYFLGGDFSAIIKSNKLNDGTLEIRIGGLKYVFCWRNLLFSLNFYIDCTLLNTYFLAGHNINMIIHNKCLINCKGNWLLAINQQISSSFMGHLTSL